MAGRLLASIRRIAPRRSAKGRLANLRFTTLGSQPKRAQRRGKPAKPTQEVCLMKLEVQKARAAAVAAELAIEAVVAARAAVPAQSRRQ